MATIFDVDQNTLIELAAKELKDKKLVQPMEWAPFVKTGAHKERPPTSPDWWYMRSASLLRTLYLMGPIGVSKLRTRYGGKKNRGHKPEHFVRGSGSIIRKILQQLEKNGFAKQVEVQGHKGRTLTPKGKAFLDAIAKQMKAPDGESNK